MPKSAAQSRTSGSIAIGMSSRRRSPRPSALADVVEQRARGVGGVGDMRRAARQPPDQVAVDGAEGSSPASARARAPSTLSSSQAAWCPRNTDRAAGRSLGHHRLVARGAQRGADRRVRRSCQTMALWIGLPVAGPRPRGLALVGDADGGDVAGADPAARSPRGRCRRWWTRGRPGRARPSREAGKCCGTPPARRRRRVSMPCRTGSRGSRWCPGRWRERRSWLLPGFGFSSRRARQPKPARALQRRDPRRSSHSRDPAPRASAIQASSGGDLVLRQPQAQLGAPPDDILGGARVFARPSASDLASVSVAPKSSPRSAAPCASPSIVARLGAVGAHQPPRPEIVRNG
jgi:hypothetical protein